jgi:hypothetical protein
MTVTAPKKLLQAIIQKDAKEAKAFLLFAVTVVHTRNEQVTANVTSSKTFD